MRLPTLDQYRKVGQCRGISQVLFKRQNDRTPERFWGLTVARKANPISCLATTEYCFRLITRSDGVRFWVGPC
jgi:hypothetical protein